MKIKKVKRKRDRLGYDYYCPSCYQTVLYFYTVTGDFMIQKPLCEVKVEECPNCNQKLSW